MLPAMDVTCDCALEPEALIRRIAEWRALAANAIERTTAPGIVRSTYPADPVIGGELRRLIDAESTCCSFLSFEVRENEGHVEVTMRYPLAAAPMLERAFPGIAADAMVPADVGPPGLEPGTDGL